ncbi:two-component sensor histidine kinase [Heyndrickxia sporothermodurans]|nr:two-component sensor histidine kinase [Heyndrickxia sporothermodurans]
MRMGIVFKLFILTTFICMLILATIFVGQTIFFKQYYAHQKVKDLKQHVKSFESEYTKNQDNPKALQTLEQDFYRNHNTWITVLDEKGYMKNVDNFHIEVQFDRSLDKTFSRKKLMIPIYYLVDIEDVLDKKPFLKKKMRISIYGIKTDSTLVPYLIGELGTFGPLLRSTLGVLDPSEIKMERTTYWENKILEKKVENYFQKEKLSKKPRAIAETPIAMQNGTITNVQFPKWNESSNIIFSNHLFLDRIKEFQTSLLLNKNQMDDNSLQILDYKQNDIKYKLLIDPMKDQDGKTIYIISLSSLQPVDEAVKMVKDYYVYIIIFALLLIFLVSFYYSRKIASPLLKINHTTRKMANLDFSEKILITSKDEIGDLSHNINLLSKTLHSHIAQLQEDIEKEKKLENTRKEFISGVSHELKTPLSIMKSCISILKDGVANHKKDYYFEAMEKEVDKMDLLIVDMLELAKFESGTYKMNYDVFYIDQVILHICDGLSLEIKEKQLNLRKHLLPVQVLANQHRIEQVITNFITNAIRHTPYKEEIILEVIDGKDMVKICVENKGAHIPIGQLDKIWDRFYRLDNARKRSNGGTGLGLAISKNILELHGVEYGVINTDDGVLFYFYLNKAD